MKAEEIKSLFDSFESIAIEYEGVECWSARELYPVLGYAKWERFKDVMVRAQESCENAGESVADHFAGVGKMVTLGSGAERHKDFAAEMTSVNVQQKDFRGQVSIEREHIDNNSAVRDMLLDRGIRPESLLSAEDVKKVEHRLKADEKKIPPKVKIMDYLINAQDEVDASKETLLAKVEAMLAQKIEQTKLVTFHWRIV